MNRDVSSWGGQFWRRADTQWTKKPLIWFINMQVKIQKESSKFLLRSLNLTILIGCILILNWFFGCDVRLLTKQGGLLYFIIFLQNALKEIQLQCICYSHWANGARNGVISIGQWGVFNHKKGAIWQSHLSAQKEGVVTAIVFSNHKTS